MWLLLPVPRQLGKRPDFRHQGHQKGNIDLYSKWVENIRFWIHMGWPRMYTCKIWSAPSNFEEHQLVWKCQIFSTTSVYFWRLASNVMASNFDVYNRVLPKSTLWMNCGWFDTSEVSHKKAHWLVIIEMSSHLFFYKSKWAFWWHTSDVSYQLKFMQRVDLGKTLLECSNFQI